MDEINRRLPQDEPAVYRIQIGGRVDERLADWFEGMTITAESKDDGRPITTLMGTVADQAALQGLLSRIYALGLLVISVTRADSLY